MVIDDFINKDFTYAVVGASNNEEKYGYKVLKDLSEAGFDVVPINPREQEILNVRAFPSLTAAEKRVDVVVFVVPPSVSESVLHEVVALGITKVWMQPGSSSEAAIAFCAANHIDCVHDVCIMLSH